MTSVYEQTALCSVALTTLAPLFVGAEFYRQIHYSYFLLLFFCIVITGMVIFGDYLMLLCHAMATSTMHCCVFILCIANNVAECVWLSHQAGLRCICVVHIKIHTIGIFIGLGPISIGLWIAIMMTRLYWIWNAVDV